MITAKEAHGLAKERSQYPVRVELYHIEKKISENSANGHYETYFIINDMYNASQIICNLESLGYVVKDSSFRGDNEISISWYKPK